MKRILVWLTRSTDGWIRNWLLLLSRYVCNFIDYESIDIDSVLKLVITHFNDTDSDFDINIDCSDWNYNNIFCIVIYSYCF